MERMMIRKCLLCMNAPGKKKKLFAFDMLFSKLD